MGIVIEYMHIEKRTKEDKGKELNKTIDIPNVMTGQDKNRSRTKYGRKVISTKITWWDTGQEQDKVQVKKIQDTEQEQDKILDKKKTRYRTRQNQRK